jgi:hypothetical protein
MLARQSGGSGEQNVLRRQVHGHSPLIRHSLGDRATLLADATMKYDLPGSLRNASAGFVSH